MYLKYHSKIKLMIIGTLIKCTMNFMHYYVRVSSTFILLYKYSGAYNNNFIS